MNIWNISLKKYLLKQQKTSIYKRIVLIPHFVLCVAFRQEFFYPIINEIPCSMSQKHGFTRRDGLEGGRKRTAKINFCSFQPSSINSSIPEILSAKEFFSSSSVYGQEHSGTSFYLESIKTIAAYIKSI